MVLLVSGIGVVVFAYATAYFPRQREGQGRLIGLLVLFAGAMLGLVLADNLLLLYVCWELTSITSYLLIGNDHTDATARAAALHALLVTAAGGLAMLGGLRPARPGRRHLPAAASPGATPDRQATAVDRRAGARAPRRVHQVGAVPVPLLAAGGDGRADAGQRLPALGDDGEGRRVPRRPVRAGVRRRRPLAAARPRRRAVHDGRRRAARPAPARPQAAARLRHGQPARAS